MLEFTEFVDGFAFGIEAFDGLGSGEPDARQHAEDLAALCENQGGEVIAGFNEAVGFASWLHARAVAAAPPLTAFGEALLAALR